MTDNARRTGPAVEAQFQFLLWLIPAVELFVRHAQQRQRVAASDRRRLESQAPD
jgi:hypothetical protein